jgi:hypothetical protein
MTPGAGDGDPHTETAVESVVDDDDRPSGRAVGEARTAMRSKTARHLLGRDGLDLVDIRRAQPHHHRPMVENRVAVLVHGPERAVGTLGRRELAGADGD